MKQYLDQQQTAKLIELGLEKPKSYHDIEWDGTEAYDYQLNYSIGELIEILPISMIFLDEEYDRIIIGNNIGYYIPNTNNRWYLCNAYRELIDNLLDMIIKLKEEGVI
jgi:hypothetical protein